MTLNSKLEGKKILFTLLKFKENITPPFMFILVTKYSKFLKNYFYQILTMDNKNITNKFRIKVQNLSSTKIFAMTNLSITRWKKKKKIKKFTLNILKYILIKKLKW